MIKENGKNNKSNLEKAEAGYKEVFGTPKGTEIQPYSTHKTYRRLFIPLVLLWCLIYQRLNPDHSCDKVVSALRAGDFDHLSQDSRKPLSQRCRSENTAGYCKARKRYPVSFFENALHQTACHGQEVTNKTLDWLKRQLVLLDGSTLLVRPHLNLANHYGRHKTGKQLSYWVLIRIVVVFYLENGFVATIKEGPMTTSEQVLARDCLAQLPPDFICVADRGFGVFNVLQTVRHNRGDAIVRLTRPRALKLVTQQLYPGNDLDVVWSFSKYDQLNPKMSDAPFEGRLIYVRLERPGFRSQDLYLFTTLLDRSVYTRNRLIEMYGLRWHVELDIRYVKETLDLSVLEDKSVDIVRKELLAAMIGYNLIRLFMLQAANQAGCSVLRLSFSMCLRRVIDFLFQDWTKIPDLPSHLEQMLVALSECKLPNRPEPRIEPRWVRPRAKYFPEFWVDRYVARQRFILNRSAKAVS